MSLFDAILAIGICLATILIGHLIKWIAENFLSAREAKIGAFSFMLGQTIVSGAAILYDLAIGALAEVAGMILGLIAIWWSFFKRRTVNV